MDLAAWSAKYDRETVDADKMAFICFCVDAWGWMDKDGYLQTHRLWMALGKLVGAGREVNPDELSPDTLRTLARFAKYPDEPPASGKSLLSRLGASR